MHMLIDSPDKIQTLIVNRQMPSSMFNANTLYSLPFCIYCCINRMQIKPCIDYDNIIIMSFQIPVDQPKFPSWLHNRKTSVYKIKTWETIYFDSFYLFRRLTSSCIVSDNGNFVSPFYQFFRNIISIILNSSHMWKKLCRKNAILSSFIIHLFSSIFNYFCFLL